MATEAVGAFPVSIPGTTLNVDFMSDGFEMTWPDTTWIPTEVIQV